jgi:hypothetical protein
MPQPGHWSLLRAHILDIVCSGDQTLFKYFIHWMAYRVQHPDVPMGVAVALLGAQGAGKGIVARTFGNLFGKHFTHITQGDQLTGRFNASLATSCVVFLDEALWAGDRKGEGVLKALITEPTFQLEAKFRDPIMVPNRLGIIVASNNDWAVPTGIGDRRWFVLNVANRYAGTGHRDYWAALYHEVENGGAAAMLHDLLGMDLSQFDVRVIPHTPAKAQQQVQSLRGTLSWLHEGLQDGAFTERGAHGQWNTVGQWQATGLTLGTDLAYNSYRDFAKERREYPEIKSVWSKNIHKALGSFVQDTRPTVCGGRVRSFQFAPLADCRRHFAQHVGSPDLAWDEPDVGPLGPAIGQTDEDVHAPRPASQNQAAGPPEPEYEPEDGGPDEWEPLPGEDDEYWPEYDPVDDPKHYVPDNGQGPLSP